MSALYIADDGAMRALGARLAEACPPRSVIYLEGNLGAGKSTLARGFLHALGHQGAVRSPTYTLVEPYALATRQVYHMDLYRLADAEELEYLGLRDWLASDAVILAEWPDHGEGVLPPADLRVVIEYAGKGRNVQLHVSNDAMFQTVAQWADEFPVIS